MGLKTNRLHSDTIFYATTLNDTIRKQITMKILKHIIPTLLLLFATGTSVLAETAPAADQPEYDVEVIIFEDAHARYINSEDWPHEALPEDSPEEVTGNTTQETSEPPNAADNKTAEFTAIKPSFLKSKYLE